jgi:hypothetical protein
LPKPWPAIDVIIHERACDQKKPKAMNQCPLAKFRATRGQINKPADYVVYLPEELRRSGLRFPVLGFGLPQSNTVQGPTSCQLVDGFSFRVKQLFSFEV